MQAAQDHLQHAKTEREYYQKQVDAAVSAWSTSPSTLCHYSYDFAQEVHFPFDSQQTGPEFFKTARKCGIFSVCNDGRNQQVNYIIDEAENPVISLVHHYFAKYGQGEKAVYLHANNCTAQNKNNASIQYLMWRVMTGRFFGLFKMLFQRSSVSTLSDIEHVMKRSTKEDQNLAQHI